MDFEKWSQIGSSMIKSVSRLPTNNGGPIEVGEVLNVDFGGNKSTVVVLVSSTLTLKFRFKVDVWYQENTSESASSTLKWRGDLMYVLSGEHTFHFEPSKITPGATTFSTYQTPIIQVHGLEKLGSTSGLKKTDKFLR